MLRLETQKVAEKKIPNRFGQETTYGIYSNEIKEVLTHFPTGHYVSLVSAYTPMSIFDKIGSVRVTDGNPNEPPLAEYDGNTPFKNLEDFISRFNTEHVKSSFTKDGHFEMALIRNDDDNDPFYLEMSASAAWFLGFDGMKFLFPNGQAPMRSHNAYPPITIRYLQIICKNACGTSDSNMTMPTTLGIMHMTDKLTLINPHIAVNHRIEKGRTIDIEILDQNNRPFTCSPVYLELFVSESTEHEKKQGFFRFEKSHAIHMHSPIKMISVANLFAAEHVTVFDFAMWRTFEVRPGNRHSVSILPYVDEFCKRLKGTAMTKSSMLGLFSYLNQELHGKYPVVGNRPPVTKRLIMARFEGDDLILETEAIYFRFNADIFLGLKLGNGEERIEVQMDRPLRLKIDPSTWYNEDSRLNLYCLEYHERYPVAVARRFGNYYQIINRSFWSWHELEKATNTLHFRAERVIAYPDGTKSITEWPKTNELLIQLFYK